MSDNEQPEWNDEQIDLGTGEQEGIGEGSPLPFNVNLCWILN